MSLPGLDPGLFELCQQCGTCSSACPITGVDGFNVRRLIRHVELGLVDVYTGTGLAWRCTVCGRCETACPNGIAILDTIRTMRAKAPEQAQPDGPPACIRACPGEIDIPGYLRFIANGEPDKACELIFEKVLFPGVLGRVCPHPCEDVCRRGEVNQPVNICALKRHAADQTKELPEVLLSPGEDTGRHVGIIGGGPAGLTAAFYLRRKGHRVTLHERSPALGGMMRYGIPAYRLPRDVLDAEIQRLLDIGIEVETGSQVGDPLDIEGLGAAGFDAVVISTGLSQSKTIPLDGTSLNGVRQAIPFLRAIASGEAPALDGGVLVIGGGDVAVDVALSAARLGADKVIMACLERREEMPAHLEEIEQALEEGVELMTSWGPKQICDTDGRVSAIDLLRCESVFDEQGLFNPSFGEEETTITADHVILATGQTSDLSVVDPSHALGVENDLVVVNPETGQTGIGWLYACGEIAMGPGSLIDAIAEAKKVARAVDLHLGGDGVLERTVESGVTVQSYDRYREEGFADRARADAERRPRAERVRDFDEITSCMVEAVARREAARCLNCDFEQQPEAVLDGVVLPEKPAQLSG
jgi:NADPH-dependent glutamate synthase beta subunit-like oxidoreductase